MSADSWEILAEVTLAHPEPSNPQSIFCLCSRVFIKNYQQDVDRQDMDVQNEIEDVCNELEPNKWCKVTSLAPEDEANSCYYSASATDCHYSTDDQDHNYPLAALHSSDSGADISEVHLGDEKERNNSLPDVLSVSGDDDVDQMWEHFWARNGESLIWSSWIDKYSDYIDPQFLHSSSSQDVLDNEVAVATASHVSTAIVVSVASPNPPSCPEEGGWNVLSPNSDIPWRGLKLGERDTLLSPRCDSVTSSIPLTIATESSMTNVTRMSPEAGDHYGDFCSSRVSSESSPMSSSVSSEDSNSNQIEPAMRCESAEGLLNDVEPGAGDSHWQGLWQIHFQEQYLIHYKKFVEAQEVLKEEACSSLKSESGISIKAKRHHHHHGTRNRTIRKKRGGRKFENLPGLIADMCIEGEEGQQGTEGEVVQEPAHPEMAFDCPELAAFGLPTSFGRQKGGGGDQPSDGRGARTLKRGHELDLDEDSTAKAAFELMGYAFASGTGGPSKGEVVYKKKHIRLHNRMLKMKNQRANRHIYFDDEGVESGVVPEVEALIHSSSDDDSHTAVAPPQRVPIAPQTTVSSENPSSLDQDDNPEAPSVPDASLETCAPEGQVQGKNKKKKRKPKLATLLPPEIVNDKSLLKYWYKRFSLFSKFDQGIKLDKESWFSVTPEKVALHIAERMRSDVIVDAFCGCGGNTIQFALTCKKVIAIDIDPKKIEMAKHNATVYGVLNSIEFIVADFLQISDSLKADAVFLSPPWGGPTYMKDEVYDVEKSLLPVPASELMARASQISSNIGIFLPRNSNTQQLSLLAGYGNSVEIEQNFLDRKLIALTAFYGNLINNQMQQ